MTALENLAGKVFAVTGASRGMGLRFARALSAEGAQVAVLARASGALDETAAAMPDALCVPCDVGSPGSVRDAFARIGDRFGKLDGLINNAATCLLHRIETSTDEEILSELHTNLAGPAFCIRAAVPLLRAAGGGDIVNISSESVLAPPQYLSLYAATKAGLETLSRGLRAELRPDKIRVTVLRSGVVSGGNISAGWDPERRDEYMRTITQAGDFTAVQPETMAAMLVHFLRLPREAHLDLVELRAM